MGLELVDLGSHGPSEEWSRGYILGGVCGYPDGAGRRRRRQMGLIQTFRPVGAWSRLPAWCGRASITISSTISWHHLGIHRHHTVCRHGSTPRVAHGSLNLRASPIHGQAASQAATAVLTCIRSLQLRSISIPHAARRYRISRRALTVYTDTYIQTYPGDV